MSVEQAVHELQEQLQRVTAGHQTMHHYTPQYGRYEVTRPVGGAKDLDARPIRKEERPELENLVVFGETLRRRGARSAEAGDEGCRESEATDRCNTPVTDEMDQELQHFLISGTEGEALEIVRGAEREPGLEQMAEIGCSI